MILKAVFAMIPAARSSATIPIPPESRLSSVRIGTGLNMSSTLKTTKPVAAVKTLKGRLKSVTSMPIISSMTMQPGSFCFNSFSA